MLIISNRKRFVRKMDTELPPQNWSNPILGGQFNIANSNRIFYLFNKFSCDKYIFKLKTFDLIDDSIMKKHYIIIMFEIKS